MSVHDEFDTPSSDSFWEPGKFMKTVKRHENGYKLCDQLRSLVESRSEIEKNYAKSLSNWSKKWNDFLDKGPEYGTCLGGWKSALIEADSLNSIHLDIADQLMNEVYQSIKAWQKENYHKSMMHFKETKELEDGFRKAQKPWGKRLQKVMKAKSDYHSVCKQEKSTANQENNARGDSTLSPDQLTKLQEKLRKLQTEVDSTKEKYEAALNDLNSYNAKYIEDMTEVYDKSQDYERKRIDFVKKTLYEIHSCLDLSVQPKFAKVYTDFHSIIGLTDADKDLKFWSKCHGVDMQMNWPVFEEYSPELQSISRRGKSHIGANDGITITGIKHNREESWESKPPERQSFTNPAQISQPISHTRTRSDENNSNPFGDADMDDHSDPEEPPSNEQGVAVRALYDYEKSEDDELNFKAGDVFVEIRGEDEMGWSKGRKNGVEGLYPANYVERL
ncbi:protein kinase C and casein kinase substrate in neurons protein 2-like isoform X2 [Gigantopelta aegis]|uniref:protein kinase C and casein kinase substrate in neurons protein 2-like isoform X2 n=1 Tax=Gigantopelta aegis TaxID=1735272 RepID=UPI001B888A86|nr:protein kinase C and casein kinase substrate in neurons protein 2-like isoform X2 [Gigantopelta aegis]